MEDHQGTDTNLKLQHSHETNGRDLMSLEFPERVISNLALATQTVAVQMLSLDLDMAMSSQESMEAALLQMYQKDLHRLQEKALETDSAWISVATK